MQKNSSTTSIISMTFLLALMVIVVGYEPLVLPTLFFVVLSIVFGIMKLWLYFKKDKLDSIHSIPLNFQPPKIKQNNPDMDFEFIEGALRDDYDKLTEKKRRWFLCELYHINYFKYEYGRTIFELIIEIGLLISFASIGIITVYSFMMGD